MDNAGQLKAALVFRAFDAPVGDGLFIELLERVNIET